MQVGKVQKMAGKVICIATKILAWGRGLTACVVLLSSGWLQATEKVSTAIGDILVNQHFQPAIIQDKSPFNVSKLSIVLTNHVAGKTLKDLNLSDSLPAGVKIAAVPNVVNSCGATVNAIAGNSVLQITGGQVPFGATCTFSVDVVASTAGTYTNTIPAGIPLTTHGDTVAEASDASLTVLSRTDYGPKVRSKTFSPNTLLSGQASTMTITLGHDNIFALTHTNLTDTFPSGMTIANPDNASTTCPGGVLTANVGAGVLSMVGGTIPIDGMGNGSCMITVDVVGTKTNSGSTQNLQNTLKAGDVSALNGQVNPPVKNSGATSGTLTVSNVPASLLSKSFSTSQTAVNQWVTMTWAIYNNTAAAWTNLSVSDTLPTGLNVYTTDPKKSTSCGGSVGTSGNTVSLNGGTLAAGKSCTVSIRVVSPTAGSFTNTIPANSMTNGATVIAHPAATATLSVVQPSSGQTPTLRVAKSFTQLLLEGAVNPANTLPIGHPPATVPGGLIQMKIVLTKVIPTGGFDTGLTSLYFKDDWGVSAPNLQYVSSSGTCNGGSISALVNGKTFTLTGGSLSQGTASCTITINLRADTSIAPPPQGTEQRNAVSACVGTATSCTGPSGTANASALIAPTPPLYPTKTFLPLSVPVNGVTKATMTIGNPSAAKRYHIAATDILPSGLKVASPANPTFSCSNNGSSVPAMTFTPNSSNPKKWTFTIASLNGFTATAAPNCTVTFDVVADTATANSSATNTILAGDVTATDINNNPDVNATNVRPANATVTFNNALIEPLLAKSFSVPVIFAQDNTQTFPLPQVSRLTLHIANRNTLTAGNYTGLSLQDTLPSGMVIAPTPNLSHQFCGSPTLTATANSGVLAVTNATVAANNVCQISVDVVGTSRGNKINTIPRNAVQMAQGLTNTDPASATLSVLSSQPLAVLIKDVVRTGSSASIQGQSVAPGDHLTYQIQIYNPGYLNIVLKNDVVRVVDTLPQGTILLNGGGSTVSGNVLTWDFSTDTRVIAPGDGITLHFDVQVNNDALAIINVAKTPTSSSCGPYDSATQNCYFDPPIANCQMPANPLQPTAAELANPGICHPVANPIAPILTLGKSGPTTLSLGGAGVYQLTVTNTGQAGTTGALKFVDQLPAGLTLHGDISSPDGTITDIVVNGQILTFSFTPTHASLARGAVATIAIPVAVELTRALDSVVNYAAVGGGGDYRGEPPTPGSSCSDTRCANTATTIMAGLVLEKTHRGAFMVGQIGTYVLTVTNQSGQAIADTLHLADLLPTGMRLIATDPITSSQGNITHVLTNGQQLSFDFTPLQPIALGAKVELTLTVAISSEALGTVINYASVTTDTTPLPPGPACSHANLCSSDSVTITGQAQLHLDKKGPATMTIGETGVYQLIINNTGTAATDGVLRLIEKLPVGLSLNDSMHSAEGEIRNVQSTGTAQTGLTVTFDFMPTTALAAGTGQASITIPVLIGPSTATGGITNYAAVGGGGDVRDDGMPPTPGRDCQDTRCANASSSIVASHALLSLVKTVNRNTVELGDMLTYTITVTNIGKHVVLQPTIIDHLPPGFRLIQHSSRVTGATLLGLDGAPGATLHYRLDVIQPGATVTLTYRVRVGVGAMEGDGTNRATAICPRNHNSQCANEARTKVRVTGGVFTTRACIVGMIFVDCNDNALKDQDELGIPGVRLYLEDGTYLISDSEGKYSYCGLSPKTHVLKVDRTTLPQDSQLGISSNRNMGDANSLFLDLKKGQLHRADFIEASCSPFVLEQVNARRRLGEVTAPQKAPQDAALSFEGKAATDAATVHRPVASQPSHRLPNMTLPGQAARQGARHAQ